MAEVPCTDAGNGLKKIESKKGKGILFFEGTWNEAIIKAKKEKKLIFLDTYTTWCGPCKRMEKSTFTDKDLGAYFNKHFINVKLDIENNSDGNRLANKFNITAIPTLFFLDHNEEIVTETAGFLDAETLLSIGKDAQKK